LIFFQVLAYDAALSFYEYLKKKNEEISEMSLALLFRLMSK
jgi:hypothetical protein